MKKLMLVCAIVSTFAATAMASDIAFYVGTPNFDGWYTADEMNANVETIIAQTGHLFKEVQKFDDTQLAELADWAIANAEDGEFDILWLNRCVPSSLYAIGNTQPEGSAIESFLDGGNMIINVGDSFGYVSYESGARGTENGTTGAANILDLAAGIIVSADNTSLTVTAAGHEYLPSLGDTVVSYRPIAPSVAVAPWEVAAVFAQNAAGTYADPIVIHNTETGGYVAFINQSTAWLDDRGVTCSEFILNWVNSVIGLANPSLAGDPVPEDGAIDIPRDVVLSWMPGTYAVTHDVYFGASFDDVNTASRSNPLDVLLSQGQSGTTFDPPGVLDFGQTYYWRVDEVNGAPDNTIYRGVVWSFTAEPLAYPIAGVVATSNGSSEAAAGPENTVNGSGLDAADQHSTESGDMWLATPGADPLWIQFEFDRVYKLHEMLVWNYNVQFEIILGFGLKGVTVEYSENGTDWAALGDFELAQGTAKATYAANTAVPFDGVPAKFVRLNVNSGYGMMGQFGLSEVRFLFIPAQAREPQPANRATRVDPATTLSWRAGRDAASHEVYLGTDADDLALADTVDSASFAPALEFGGTYYWQIVEVNEADAVTAWPGDVWRFSTLEYASIDGFETYDDDVDAGTTIFDTWLDGWVNETGSTVGYLNAPFAEKTIVHSGKQSMPLAYDNSTSPFYSEAWREFETAQNWTGNGADTLVLYVRGNAPDFAETAGGQIIMSAVGTDIWNTTDQFRYAYKNLSGDGSMTVRVDSLVRSNEWAKAGVMIRETLEPGSKHAFMCVTPDHGTTFQRRPVAGQASASTDVGGAAAPRWVRLTRTGNVFTAHDSIDGVTWTEAVVSPALTIEMAANVYVGLAVTSHDGVIVTAAEFSNLSATGNVTGAWQVAEIGAAQPQGNSAESMYVTIEDSAGKSATVVNADASITQRATWQEWAIPYAELSGVNLSRVEKMVIGVGSATAPKAGGTGTVYIDDIGYGRPAPEPAYVNLLANGGFEDGVMAPWSTYGDVTAEVVSEGATEGESCLHITVNSAGANFWDAGLQHTGHAFEAGKQYTLSAFLRCSAGTLDINFKPELAADPWTGFGDQIFTMTNEWAEFSVTTPVLEANVSPAAITFHIAFAAAEFWIDGVRFYEGQYVAP